ncbi:MAG TPA: thiamine biosynthesis protein ApbE [Spirochaetaceae bacterium]|nr:thiamine biosynthesis protein ApbE [Spirochaetaceae bacterium]
MTLLAGGDNDSLRSAFERIQAIETMMSARQDGSSLMAVNRAAGREAVEVDPELYFVVEQALRYATLTGGRFDPTIDPLARLWDIQGGTERIPAPDEIAAALDLVDSTAVTLNPVNHSIFLTRGGMSLDLGAIAKGYAADAVATVLKAEGVEAAIIDLGGNIVVLGNKADGSPWRVGVKNPFNPGSAYLGILSLEGSGTMVTSGIYERFFIGPDGQHYHHIFNTADGYPVQNGLLSVTVLSQSSLDADALSTSLFALGLEAGLALAEELDEVEALFVDANHRLSATTGMRRLFTISDTAFSWADAP